ncbi:MAG: HAMP domain-containing sensor histidine kinase [Verrucomicrobiota bacterium]
MLRTRLFLGLLTLVLLLWAVGGTGFVMLRGVGKKFDSQLNADYPVIRAAQRIRSITSTVNSTYLSRLVTGPLGTVDPALFAKASERLDENLIIISGAAAAENGWKSELADLLESVGAYRSAYTAAIANPPATEAARAEFHILVSGLTQRTTDTANTITSIAEERMLASSRGLVRNSRKDLLLIASLVAFGTMMAILTYRELLKHLVDPVMSLQQSMKMVMEGNYESVAPDPARGSEFQSLVSAFNDMNAELRIRRKSTDQKLLHENIVNRALLSAIPSPLYVVADNLLGIVLNPAAEDLNAALGCGVSLPDKVRRLYDECVATGMNLRPEDPREAILFRVNGEERFYLPRIFRFESPDGGYSGWAILLHNTTRIRWLDDMKSNLLATVSHEIKTPLTSIRMVLLLMLEEKSGELSPLQKTMLASASADCERLLATLNSLLDLSRAESGATRLDLAPMDLAAAARTCVALFQADARSREVNLSIVGPADPLPLVCADEIRLREVINNLISNALKHCQHAGEVSVLLTQAEEGFVRLCVIDDGEGVPPEAQSRIFERFYRANNNHNVDGIGLGLFICREIMRAHDGRIGLGDHAPGMLTEFYIDVPVA